MTLKKECHTAGISEWKQQDQRHLDILLSPGKVRSERYWVFVTPVKVFLVLYRTISILYFTVYMYDGSSQSVLIEHH